MVEKAVFERMLPPVFGKESLVENATDTQTRGIGFLFYGT